MDINALKEFNTKMFQMTRLRSRRDLLLDFTYYAHKMRNMDEEIIIEAFEEIMNVYVLDSTTSCHDYNMGEIMRWLFFIRDPRHGLGERRVFRVILKHMAIKYPDYLRGLLAWHTSWTLNNGPIIPYYGRWDDLLVLMGTPLEREAVDLIYDQLRKDMNSNESSLLSKWLPSINGGKKSKRMAYKLSRSMGLTAKEYRKMMSICRKNIKHNKYEEDKADTNMSYWEIYDSLAKDIRTANLNKNDNMSYTDMLQNVADKWFSLPNYDVQTIVVPDLTMKYDHLGEWMHNMSMLDFAITTSIYMSERLFGIFHDQIIIQERGIPFSHSFYRFAHKRLDRNLEFIEMADYDRFEYFDFNDICEVLELIFDRVQKSSVTFNIPKYVLFIAKNRSGYMDPDRAEEIKNKYREKGYQVPHIVIWNLGEYVNPIPFTMMDDGITYINGCNKEIIDKVIHEQFNGHTELRKEISKNYWDPISIAYTHGLTWKPISSFCGTCKLKPNHSGS